MKLPMVPRGLARRGFFIYAPLLFIATHWRNVQIPIPGRPDLLVHAAVFGAWTALLIACRFFGPALAGRNIALCTLIGALYAGIDEGLQAIPWIRRHAAWDDWGANLIGVFGVALGASILAAAARPSPATPRATPEPPA